MEAKARPNLLYVCPSCQQEVSVGPGSIGAKVTCPIGECRAPFMAAVPVGKYVGHVDPADGKERTSVGGDARPEEVLLVVRPAMFRSRPLSTLGVGLLILGGVAGTIALLGGGPVAALGLIPIGVGLAIVFSWYLETMSTKLVVTDDRTTLSQGIFSRDGNEVQHDDVRNIQVEQNVFERMMDVGRIKISSAGQGDVEIDARHMPDPTDVAAIVRRYQ
ncbi:MAG: PH domain-containing protein [Planctomycetota bacterium]